jgi:hypothetical protein
MKTRVRGVNHTFGKDPQNAVIHVTWAQFEALEARIRSGTAGADRCWDDLDDGQLRSVFGEVFFEEVKPLLDRSRSGKGLPQLAPHLPEAMPERRIERAA